MSETIKTTENPKIYAAIAGVIADCGVVGKDKVNKQQGFKYRSVDDVFNALHPALAKNKVVIIPTVVERNCEEVGKTKNGTSILKVICKVKYDICAEDGSHVTSIICPLFRKCQKIHLMSCGTRYRLLMLLLSGHRRSCMSVIRKM